MLTIKVFLDTNVLIDVLSAAKRPATEYSSRIFQGIRNYKLEGVMTVQSIVDATYVFRRDPGTQSLFRDKIFQIRNYVNVEPLNDFDLQDALLSGEPDFEDALQVYHAYHARCDYFITSDRELSNRPPFSGMQFCTPGDFVRKIQEMALEERTNGTLTPERTRED
ncbi:MAG: PIN domain-containing protein [Bacteroidales bacterium]|nr:PIN domain-containing protein [Bacteroidales bacterium]